MIEAFTFDVFLSHSSKDKGVVRQIANRLRQEGLRVWFDDWEIRPGDSIPSKIDQGLEESRVLVLCMSEHAFGSDWARMEAGTFRFRDPLNKDRRFIPLRLDEAPIKGSLTQFLYIDWRPEGDDKKFDKLFEACRPTAKLESAVRLSLDSEIAACALSSDGRLALTCSPKDPRVRLWEVNSGSLVRVFEGHTNHVLTVAFSADSRLAISGGVDKNMRLWDVESGRSVRTFAHKSTVQAVALSLDARFAVSGASDRAVRVWDISSGSCVHVLWGHDDIVLAVALSPNNRFALSGSMDRNVVLWDVEQGIVDSRRLHRDHVFAVAIADSRFALSAGMDRTVHLSDLNLSGADVTLEGHTGAVTIVGLSANGRVAFSGSNDRTVRLWDAKTGKCLCILEGHTHAIKGVLLSSHERRAISVDGQGIVRIWDLSPLASVLPTPDSLNLDLSLAQDQVQYTNAKVLLVGESGVGKTGLSKVLAGEDWRPSDSTSGSWATRWKLSTPSSDGVEREIWLWDFGGQADQRLIHQLYMEDTALVVLVFDGQKDQLFETLGQWDRDLTRASRKQFAKILVAGRIDVGRLRVSRAEVESFARERGFANFLETSAKARIGCQQLKDAIVAGIRWTDIPWHSSPRLFKRLREEIIRLKDEGRVLMRFNELRDALRLRLAGDVHFSDDELEAVVSLLAGPGVVWELEFGSWVLLQPERINAYAQAVIQTVHADKDERGCISEERVLRGDLAGR